jgi:hypothetical protein
MKIQKVSAGLVQLFIVFHAGSLVMGDAPASLLGLKTFMGSFHELLHHAFESLL